MDASTMQVTLARLRSELQSLRLCLQEACDRVAIIEWIVANGDAASFSPPNGNGKAPALTTSAGLGKSEGPNGAHQGVSDGTDEAHAGRAKHASRGPRSGLIRKRARGNLRQDDHHNDKEEQRVEGVRAPVASTPARRCSRRSY